MMVPTFLDEKMVDENGKLTPSWRGRFDQLFSQLQQNFGPEGVVVPNVAAQNVADLSKSGNGTMLYSKDATNPTNDKVQVKINGVFKTVQVI